MATFRDLIQVRTIMGRPVAARDVVVTPQSRALAVRLPYGAWTLTWPTAVLVARGETVERLPIVDLTRLAQWALAAAGLLAAISTLLSRKPRKD